MDSQELLLPQHYSTRNKANSSDAVTPVPHYNNEVRKKKYPPNYQNTKIESTRHWTDRRQTSDWLTRHRITQINRKLIQIINRPSKTIFFKIFKDFCWFIFKVIRFSFVSRVST